MAKRKYHNDWIIEHKDDFFSWAEMCDEYNKIFNTDVPRLRFKNHCNGDLGLKLNNYYYTEEQKAFLIEHYPKLGSKRTTEEFNKRFNQNRSRHSIRELCFSYLKVRLDEDGLAEYRRYTTDNLVNYNKTVKAHEVGTIGRHANGYAMIKLEDGTWDYLARYLYRKHIGEIPEGYQVIFLDGDRENTDIDNLAAIPLSHQTIMNTLKLRSDNVDITQTAIAWCDLYQLLKSEDVYIDTD